MKLTNPTLDELDELFSRKIAGWTVHPLSSVDVADVPPDADWKKYTATDTGFVRPNWTENMNAVLPWLEVLWFFQVTKNTPRRPTTAVYSVEVAVLDVSHPDGQRRYYGDAMTLPLAAVVALLRAHGVEVEFT